MATISLETSNTGWPLLERFPDLVQPGDIVHMQNDTLMSPLVRIFQTGRWDRLAWSSHSGLVVPPTTCSHLIESRWLTQVDAFVRYRPTRTRLIVHRKVDAPLTPEQREGVCQFALGYEGQTYGVGKFVLHLLDGIFGGIYFFRRLICDDRHPVCSYLVARAYAAHTDVRFGPRPEAASPDDIMDYCAEGDWQMVWADSQDTVDSYNKTYPRRAQRRQKRAERAARRQRRPQRQQTKAQS